jgi:hypothetical protein
VAEVNADGLESGEDIIFMKVGVHASEPLDEILERKRQEIADEGLSMWGYGGGTCHPNRVRSFAAESSGQVTLVMQEIRSNHFAVPVRASRYSADGGQNWLPVPSGINVRGSKYALCLGRIDDADFSLDLGQTRVASGLQTGRSGLDYIRGRVDKGCLRVVGDEVESNPDAVVHISFTSPLIAPFAVLLSD